MKKYSIFMLFSVWCLFLNGQEKKENPGESFSFNVGMDAGYFRYGIRMSDPDTQYNIIMVSDAIDAAGFHFDYSFGRRFSLGIFYDHNGLFVKPFSENLTYYDKISFNNFGLSPKIKFISRANTRIYFEILPIFSMLGFQKKGQGSDNEFKSNGIGYHTALGWEQFIGKRFGFSLMTAGSEIFYQTEKMYDIQYPNDPQPSSLGYLKARVFRFGILAGLLVRF